MKYRPEAFLRAVFIAPPCPPFSWCMAFTTDGYLFAYSSAIFPVSSEEPSSIISIYASSPPGKSDSMQYLI